jgi:hypothetical protein
LEYFDFDSLLYGFRFLHNDSCFLLLLLLLMNREFKTILKTVVCCTCSNANFYNKQKQRSSSNASHHITLSHSIALDLLLLCVGERLRVGFLLRLLLAQLSHANTNRSRIRHRRKHVFTDLCFGLRFLSLNQTYTPTDMLNNSQKAVLPSPLLPLVLSPSTSKTPCKHRPHTQTNSQMKRENKTATK